ncbi:MAG: hypothetical protein ACSLFK_11470 [Gemmatimonadaceae bacterium]
MPTRRRRLILASGVGLMAALLVSRGFLLNAEHHSDFSAVWFGARSLLDGMNPYPLVGPGLPLDVRWELRYPGPAFVAMLPMGLLPEWLASVLFAGVSAFLLAYGMTRESWHRVPALISGPFLLGAAAAQWSPLFTASWFIPQIAVIFAIKPTSGLAAFLYSPTGAHRRSALIGAALLTAISLVLLPSWPADWFDRVTTTGDYASPILQRGGFLTALVLIRWRCREAWVVFLLAIVPQAHSIYDVLPLLVLVPRTYREAIFLSGASSLGFLLMVLPEDYGASYYVTLGFLRNLTCYLPAAALVLMRRTS